MTLVRMAGPCGVPSTTLLKNSPAVPSSQERGGRRGLEGEGDQGGGSHSETKYAHFIFSQECSSNWGRIPLPQQLHFGILDLSSWRIVFVVGKIPDNWGVNWSLEGGARKDAWILGWASRNGAQL